MSQPPQAVSLNGTASSGPAEPLLSMRGATLGYAGRPVLREIDFEIGSGEFWCFLGPNGEGKTTLIKALLGALRPQRGAVLRQRRLFDEGKVSYVPQRLELNPVLPMAVREFVLTGLACLRMDGMRRSSRLRRVLELVGLEKMERQNYWALSGGQKQRALVARALIRNPALLIVDEPTAGLDFAAAEAVLRVLRDLYQTFGVTIVFVTHDLSIAAEHATHLAFFRGGRVVAGPKQQVLTADRLALTFGVPMSLGIDAMGRAVIHSSASADSQATEEAQRTGAPV